MQSETSKLITDYEIRNSLIFYFQHVATPRICSRVFNLIRVTSSHGSTAQIGPWPPQLGFRNNNLITGLYC
jgi:hypothetical protein